MVDLPKKKVGIVACSGEELAGGTVARLAALQVLEQHRPQDTVTICLPLFLAGGEGDRAFARFYPTIAVDGCELRCAARGTEMYSGKPAASLVVSELAAELGLEMPHNPRRLERSGFALVEATAGRMAELVDELLDRPWSRRSGQFISLEEISGGQVVGLQEASEAVCSCGSGIPVRKVTIEGQSVALAALPLIFENFHQQGKSPQAGLASELLETVRIYNPIPSGADETYAETLLREYAAYCAAQEAVK